MPAQPGARPAAGSPPTREEHQYDLSAFSIDEQSAPTFHAFGNAMHEAGATQEHVAAALAWHEAHTARELQAEEASNAQAAAEARAALKEEWGHEFDANLRLLDGFLEQLPPSVSFALRTAYTDEGVLLLNDPEAVQWLVGLARGRSQTGITRPARPQFTRQGRGREPVSSSGLPSEELADLEQMMGDARSPYWKGPQAERLQARYRDLTQDSAPPSRAEPGPSAPGSRWAAAEIRKLEAMMKDPRSEYWKGPNAEANQARYRDLLTGSPSARREPQQPMGGDKRRFHAR